MSVDMEELKQRIQELRAILKELAEERGLTDPKVVNASKKLDQLLLEYEKLFVLHPD